MRRRRSCYPCCEVSSVNSAQHLTRRTKLCQILRHNSSPVTTQQRSSVLHIGVTTEFVIMSRAPPGKEGYYCTVAMPVKLTRFQGLQYFTSTLGQHAKDHQLALSLPVKLTRFQGLQSFTGTLGQHANDHQLALLGQPDIYCWSKVSIKD